MVVARVTASLCSNCTSTHGRPSSRVKGTKQGRGKVTETGREVEKRVICIYMPLQREGLTRPWSCTKRRVCPRILHMRYFAALCAIKRTTSLAPSLRSRLRYLRQCGVNLAPHGTRCGMKYLSHTIIKLLRYHIQWKSAFKMVCCKRYRSYLGPRRERL